MVEVKTTDKENAIKVCQNSGIEYKENITSVILATENGNILGECVYDIEHNTMILRSIFPNDFVMADSLLRSALFIAANKGIMHVFWAEKVSADMIQRLGFVKNITNCSIDVTNLFSSCENCKKDK